MASDHSFHDYIMQDVLRDVAGITSRAMFGGWGIYKNGVIFAIIADGELYFKVDDTIVANFEKAGSHPFVYEGKNKPMTMSYWVVPDNVIENQELLPIWVERSVQVSMRGKTKK